MHTEDSLMVSINVSFFFFFFLCISYALCFRGCVYWTTHANIKEILDVQADLQLIHFCNTDVL